MAMGDASMYGALAGSVLFNLSPDAQREKVLLYLLVSVAPFAVVAPAIGPTVDRIPGGRRMVMQITAVSRAVFYVIMAFHVDDLLLYPLVFGSMVMSKTYAVSKSALVPLVVRNETELVEANSKLSLISATTGALIVGPMALIGKFSEGVALFLGAAVFIGATWAARQLPRDVVAATRAEQAERVELRSSGIVLASGAMTMIRAVVGFLAFHLFFWIREDYGLAQVGLAVGASTIGSILGNVSAPVLRRTVHEEKMLVLALSIIAVAATGAALTGGLLTAYLLALTVNFSGAIARLAFDATVQRDAPDANQGRAFARFETRFQLAWVVASILPVAYTLPGKVGFLLVAVVGGFAAVTYVIGLRAVRAGRPLPLSLTSRAWRAARRAATPARGQKRPITPDPRDRRGTLPPPTSPPDPRHNPR